jgi:hypothetical protein
MMYKFLNLFIHGSGSGTDPDPVCSKKSDPVRNLIGSTTLIFALIAAPFGDIFESTVAPCSVRHGGGRIK